MKPPASANNIIWTCILSEGGLLTLGLVLGWLGFYQTSQPLADLTQRSSIQAVYDGALATIPMLLGLIIFDRCRIAWNRPIHELTDRYLRPLFADSSLFDLLAVAVMAGFCEALLFRWCLQGGLQDFFETTLGKPSSVYLAIGVASVTFGVCHWVNFSYAIYATLAGLYLGWLMCLTNNWLTPAVAHFLFDFVALIYFTRWYRADPADVERENGSANIQPR